MLATLDSAEMAPTRNAAAYGRDKIPFGPWYGMAWRALDPAERYHLEHYTRQGRHMPTAWDAPVAILSYPSKMPSASFSMTAGKTCPGAKFGAGTICESCYASGALARGKTETGRKRANGRGYNFRPHVKRALLVRMYWAQISTGTDADRESFVSGMVQAIAAAGSDVFRIHDAGDFFNPRYVEAWALIVERLPGIRFWAPTRSWHLPGQRWAAAFARINALPNAIIRPSALNVNVDAPRLDGFAAGSGVKAVGWNCPASSQGNACRNCRMCWDRTAEVYYHLH